MLRGLVVLGQGVKAESWMILKRYGRGTKHEAPSRVIHVVVQIYPCVYWNGMGRGYEWMLELREEMPSTSHTYGDDGAAWSAWLTLIWQNPYTLLDATSTCATRLSFGL
jgi:hypothetical protein